MGIGEPIISADSHVTGALLVIPDIDLKTNSLSFTGTRNAIEDESLSSVRYTRAVSLEILPCRKT